MKALWIVVLVAVVSVAGIGAGCAGSYSGPATTPERAYSTSEAVPWVGIYRGSVDSYRADGSVARDQVLAVAIRLIDADLTNPYWQVSWHWLSSGEGLTLSLGDEVDWDTVKVKPKFSTNSSSYRGTGVAGDGAAVHFSFALTGDRLTTTIFWSKSDASNRVTQGRAEGVLVKEQ
jgi:hypothetical protein